MMIESYQHETHYELLSKWLSAYDFPAIPKQYFSDIGFCVDRTAIGFLFVTYGRQAYIDNLVMDREAPAPQREEAMITLLDLLERTAKHAGCELVTVLGKLPTMKRRFEQLGFRAVGDYTLYYKTIGGLSCPG